MPCAMEKAKGNFTGGQYSVTIDKKLDDLGFKTVNVDCYVPPRDEIASCPEFTSVCVEQSIETKENNIGVCKSQKEEYKANENINATQCKEEANFKDPTSVNCNEHNLSTQNFHCEPITESQKSVYRTDYEKKGFLTIPYRHIIAAFDATAGISTPGKGIDEKYKSYKDPTNFKRFTIETPTAETIGTGTSNISSASDIYQSWSGPFSALSEYMDTISISGVRNMKNQQQYRDPLLSWKDRFGDCKLMIHKNKN